MCLMVADMLEFVPVNKDLRFAAGTGHKLQLAYSETLGLYIGQWNQVSVQPLPAEELDIRDDQDPRGNVTEYEFSHEEFRQLQIEFWSKFYAYCLQYQEELSRPLALLFNQSTNMGYLSFLVPCSQMDHLYLLPDEQLMNEVESASLDESEFSHDLLSLVQCLRLIRDSVSVEMALTMEMTCCRRQENLMEDIHSKLQEIKNPINAIGVLVREMDYETDVEMERGFIQPLNVRMHLSQLYGSSTTVNMVCRCVYKMAITRFLICRDLLILQQLLLRLGDAAILGGGQLFHTQQNLLHRTSHMILSYYLIRWAKCLMGTCQYAQLQALDCFCQAASEVGKEEFLDRLIRTEDVEMASTPRLQYYDKVLRLLDTMGLPELIIQLATLAITEAADDWRSQATLRTCIFKHHLDLGHNSQAYEALTHNPDPGRQLDCLRQLVVVLCERSQLQDLVEFPYVVGIIEYRARAVDLMTHNYYELLYAFHVYRHNYRKAGTYERPGASPKRSYDGESAAAPRNSSPKELVALLVQAGLFDTAISLCQTYKLSLKPVFEGLTFKGSSFDRSMGLASCKSVFICHHHEGDQEVDAAELLRLYLNYDLLEEAADLVLEYVDALLGKGHDYFGIEVKF
ncbi:hypothetical protein EYD10_11623 [Varanus komodoensis]|nr:hypothetical protein EYD10_11623 [Varanus komodoensis]